MRFIVAAASLVIVCGSAALAQGINNPIDDVRNPVGALQRAMARRRLMEYAGIAEVENIRLRAAGQARIDAGRASTTFQRTTGPIAPAKYGALAPNPADRPTWTQNYIGGLESFNSAAQQYKINQNDVADGMGLALAVAYSVYSGTRIATPEQRGIFTEATRQNLLQNAIFQSYSDQDRQLIYEMHGMIAGLALRNSTAAEIADSSMLRTEALKAAVDTLTNLWPYPIGGMELTSAGFGDRGMRLVREGKATTQFRPSPAPLVTDPQQLDAWRAFVRVAQAQKIPMNDLSATMALCVLINWINARGGQPLDQQTQLWTFSGMKKIILTNPDWQRMSDADKESNLESFAIKTMAANAEMVQAQRPMPEQLSGQMLRAARGMGVDQASLRAGKIRIASLHAQMVLDSFFTPQFAQYTLTENGFALANSIQQR